jgi:lysozyme family protein
MKDNFDKAFSLTVGLEGEYSNDPSDSGGETKWGISQKAYPSLDIKNLTIEKAKEIYLIDYWMRIDCNSLPSPLDILVFDSAVNLGIGATKKLLERSDLDSLRFLLNRIDYYVELAKKSESARKFFRGWVNRVIHLYKMLA